MEDYRWSSKFSNDEIRQLVQVRRQHFPYPRLLHTPLFHCWRCGCQDWGDVLNEPRRLGEVRLKVETELWECSGCGARFHGHLDETTVTQLEDEAEEAGGEGA